MRKVISLIVVLSLTTITLTGCWDRVEIEEIGFVLGVGIDLQKKEDVEERAERAAPGKPEGKRRYLLTQQIAIPGGLQGGQGSGAGGADQKAYYNIVSEGDTMFEMVRSVAARTSRTPYYEHIKIIIISEEIAKTKGALADVLDYFIRFPEMRRGTKVMISKVPAGKILTIEPPNEKIPVTYIDSISRNAFKNSRMLPPTRIGDLHEHLLEEDSFVVQRINIGKDEVKIAGNAVFNGANNKMVGYLGEEETEGMNFITGEIKGGLVEVKVGDNLIIYEIKSASSRIKADVSDINQIRFTIDILVDGNIPESLKNANFFDPDRMDKVEEKVAAEVKRLCMDAINKLQKGFKTDTLELGELLQNEHTKVWKQIYKDWDSGKNYFAQSKIIVNVKAQARYPGTINRVEKKR